MQFGEMLSDEKGVVKAAGADMFFDGREGDDDETLARSGEFGSKNGV